jgi:hypothetical protein
MERKITGTDTYDHFIGSGALAYGWWDVLTHTGPETDAWQVTTRDGEAGPEDDPGRVFTLDHAHIMSAVGTLARGWIEYALTGYKPGLLDSAGLETMRQCALFLTDLDSADFDACSADEVMQWAVFGHVIYG